jgi:predicted DNA-binding transcriptional regulator YafY
MDYTKRIHRMLRILTLVQSEREWTPKRLAEEFDVAERTIYRDLEAIKDAGVPMLFDKETGQYRIVGAFFMPPVHLSLEESLALAALAEHLGQGEQIPYLGSAGRALQKIETQLPASLREQVAARAGDVAILTAAANPEDAVDVYNTVRSALANRRKLLCRYEPLRPGADESAEFELAPYALLFSVRAWYVIGQRSDRDGLRCLKLNRFTKIVPTERPYAVPDEFSLDGYLGNAWRMIPGGDDVEVVVKFDADFAQTVSDTIWHRTQDIEWHEDESCTFRCTVSGLDEIAWWVLSMGPHCTVLEPPALRDRVRDLAEKTAARYGA